MPLANTTPENHLATLRQQITELIARNAVTMVQRAIDSVNEEGQYQAIKYLFEMIGLYPAAGGNEDEIQESLAQRLLAELGLLEMSAATSLTEPGPRIRPVK
jgi:hypothetical protein